MRDPSPTLPALLRAAGRALVLALLAVVLVAAPAQAQEPESQPGFADAPFQAIDAWFGQYVVAPLAQVLFFDLVFWDNTLPPGEGVGMRVGDEVITGYGPEGYVYQRIVTLQEPVPALEPPRSARLGELDVTLASEWVAAPEGEGEPRVVARVHAQEVDLEALGVAPAAPDTPDTEAVVTVETLSPFPVQVDRRTGQVVPAEVPLATERVPPVAPGDRVLVGPDAFAEVLEVTPAGQAIARAEAQRVDPTPLPNPENAELPVVVAWLVMGAFFFTLRMGFVNIWAFGHALAITAGRYDDPEDEGEISHFQALSSALSATVGLGNIAGVAIAISMGGPGAVFWMVLAGFLGMSAKFTECTLGQMYRVVRPDGSVSGGPMHYLDAGLAELGLPRAFGKVLAVMFAVMCVGGSLGGGNMFQANQSYAAVSQFVPFLEERAWLYGIVLAFLVGLVIIGGIKRIGAVAGLIVPAMCVVYVGAGAFVLVVHAADVPAAAATIVTQAFTPEAGFGGLVGVLAQGFRRASFSSEAGVGSASIAHSAASTPYPVREGIVALLEPFIDTVVVCSTTALVVVVTGTYLDRGVEGVVMTQNAFGSVIPWFPGLLAFAVLMFAFSTMISWSYYGERCATWLFGDRVRMPYRALFLFCVFLGAVINLGNVVDFSDLMILGMAFPNILGAVLLSNKVKAALDAYWAKLKSGELTPAHRA